MTESTLSKALPVILYLIMIIAIFWVIWYLTYGNRSLEDVRSGFIPDMINSLAIYQVENMEGA